MKKYSRIVFFLSLISIIQNSFAADPCLRDLSWLKGTWKMQEQNSITVEDWAMDGSVMKCKSFEVKGTDTTMIENASLSCIGGKVVFTFLPILIDKSDERKPVHFVLTSSIENTYVFENKEHDFPQRVVYQKVSANECHAWIEGPENGKNKKVDFYYRRSE